ncbi:hypothetical protein [Pontibacter oryzae]|uniref:hypothetical protein n=1 Tax=Pontibacter oryzae TaxID=2304593 RepID=UPI0011C425DF|nr:hypothetical protein [Pontibacter oryzae]
MRIPPKNTQTTPMEENNTLNESHVNLMQSWLNLRRMDNKLAATKYKDLTEHPKPSRKQKSI